jgi:hypothetical protein
LLRRTKVSHVKADELGSSPLAKTREATDQATSGAVEPNQVGL